MNFWVLAIPAGFIIGGTIAVYVRLKRPDWARPLAYIVFGMVSVILVQQFVRLMSG